MDYILAKIWLFLVAVGFHIWIGIESGWGIVIAFWGFIIGIGITLLALAVVADRIGEK